jgi:hypothetical protein
MMAQRDQSEAASVQRSQQRQIDDDDFSRSFSERCDVEVKPAMEVVVARLRRDGGDGLIVEVDADVSRQRRHRLTLWMSLRGDIDGAPRQDRHPYLQLDADVTRHRVILSEGDMWQGQGGHRSGRVGDWRLEEMTAAAVTDEIMAVLRRAFGEVAT